MGVINENRKRRALPLNALQAPGHAADSLHPPDDRVGIHAHGLSGRRGRQRVEHVVASQQRKVYGRLERATSQNNVGSAYGHGPDARRHVGTRRIQTV